MKDKLPLVSIIIPVYNEEKYLDFCLSSLIDQNYLNKEIIVVDDGSKDKSKEIAQKYEVKLIEQSHNGSGAARNLGAKYANGNILVFVDADMKFDENYIQNLIKPILENKAIGTFVKEELVANTNNIWSKCWSINSNLPFNRRLPENYSDTENAFRAILKSVFLKSGGFNINEGYTDDSSISKKLKIKAINAKEAICYHYNPSSLLEVYYSARWIGRSKLFKPNLKNLLRFSPVNSIRISIKYLFKGAPFAIILFKLIFDAGMFNGIFFRNGKTVK